MEISKKLKRIISLVLVWVMFTTCIPDSFISVVRAYAEDSTGESQESVRKTIKLNFTLGGNDENSATNESEEKNDSTGEENTTPEDVQLLNDESEHIIFTLYQITTENGLEKKVSATYPDSVKDNTETQSDDSITAKIEKSSDADNKYTVTLTNISPDDSYVYTLQNQKTTDQTPVLLASSTLDTTVDAADITVNANNTDTVAVKGWVTQNVSNDPVSVTYTVFPVIKNGENNVILTDDVLYTEMINVGSATDGANPAFENTVTKNDDIKGYAVKFEGDDIKTKLVTANLTDDTGYTVGSENTPEELEAKAIDLYADFGIGGLDLEENETVKGTVTIKKKNENDEYDVINTSQEQSLVGSIKLGTVQDEDAEYKVTVQVKESTSYKEKEYSIFDGTLDKKSITSAKDTPGNRSYMINDNAKAEKKVELNADNGNVDISITDKESSVNKSEFKYGDEIKISAAIKEGTFTDDELQSNEIQNLTPTIILQYKESEAENWKDITSEDGGYLLNYVGTYQITVSYKETPYSKAAEITKSFTAGKADSENVFNNGISSYDIITSTNEQSIQLKDYLKDGYSIKQIDLGKTPDSEKISLNDGTKLKIPAEYTGIISVKYILTSDIYEIPANTSLTLNVKYGEITDKLISNVKNTEVYSNKEGYQPKVTIPDGYTYKSISFAAEKSSDADNIVYDENKKEISVPGGTEATYTCIFYLTKDDKIYQKTEKITVDTKNPEINFDDPLKEADTVYANASVEAKLSVEESNKGTVSIKVSVDGSETDEKTLDSDSKWAETFALAENETQKIISIHVEITDLAGNSSSSDRKIVLDKIKPVLEITDSEESGDNEYKKPGDSYYYAKRTVLITVTEDNSFNEEDFCEQLKKAIQVKIKGEDFKFITTDADSKQYYTITDTKEPDKKVYKIEFTGDAYYKMDNNFQYKDLAGNVSESSVSIKEFVIDNTKPTADQMDLSYFQATDVNAQTSTIKFFATKALKAELQYATILNNGTISDNRNAIFSLTGVQDNLLKVTVSYALENTLIESKSNNDWEKLNWMPITPEFVDSNGNYNVTLDKKTPDDTYYIYYKLEDDAGNVSYYDGLGLAWDNTLPVITVEQALDKDEVATEATLYKSDDVTLNFSIKEKNFHDVTLSVKKDGVEETGVTWKDPWNNNNDIWTNSLELKSVDKEEDVYEIEVACKDKAGNKTTWTSTIYIDRKCPEIKVEYPDNNGNGLYFSKNTEIKIRANDLTLNTDTLKERIKNGITAVNMAGEPLTNAFEISEWNTKDNQYIVTFKNEAIYTINLEYSDETENSAKVSYVQGRKSVENTFVIDNTAPEITVTYDKYNSETPHYYKEARSATIEVKDLSYIYYEQNKSKGQPLAVSEIGTMITESNPLADADGKEEMHTEGEWSYEDNKYTRTVDFKKDGIYTLEITGADKLGNKIENVVYQAQEEKTTITDGSSFVIDGTAPQVTVTYSPNNSNPHYKENRTATIEVKDLSYIYYDESKKDGEIYLNRQDAALKTQVIVKNVDNTDIDNTDAELKAEGYYTDQKWAEKKDSHSYKKTITYTGNAHYHFSFSSMKDICGNAVDDEKRYTADFWIDKAIPEIRVSYDNNDVKNESYFNKNRIATIEIQDSASSFNATKVKINITARDKDGHDVKDAYTISSSEWETTSNADKTVHRNRITFNTSAYYTFNVTYENEAGSTAKDIQFADEVQAGAEFCVDKVAPTGTLQMKTYKWTELIKNPEAILSYKEKIEFTAESADNFGVDSVKYKKVLKVLDKNSYTADELESWTWTKYKEAITEAPNQDFTIYLRIEDNAGNVTYINSQGIILDDIAPEIEFSYDITEKFADNSTHTKTFNAAEIVLTMKITENHFVNENTVVKINDAVKSGLTWTASDEDERMWTSSITLTAGDNKAESYKVSVSTKDTAGNETAYEETAVIDRQAPVITLTYDQTENAGELHYYNKARSAEIQVDEIYSLDKDAFRQAIIDGINATDINNENVSLKEITDDSGLIKAVGVKDGQVYYTISTWNELQNTYTVTFSADAIYSVGVKYTDKSGNTNSDVKFANEVKDGASFVIDTQKPVISVEYKDEDSSKTGKTHYYKGKRQAEITLQDLSYLYENTVQKVSIPAPARNKMSSGINDLNLAVDLNGADITAQIQKGEWLFDTNKYTRVVTFEDDAIYEFGLSGWDICKNQIDAKDVSYNVDDGTSFVIDRQAPVIEVTYNDNSENKEKDHYYKGDRKATVTVKDLSCIYENTIQNVAVGADNTGITGIGYSITAKDEKDITVSDNKSGWVSDGNWSYDSDKRQYTRDIIFTGDAIYTFEVNGTDICGNTSEYKDEKSDITYNAADGTSFVIDTQAPVVTVEYNDSSKLQDHYYSDTRTATISVKDLSYVYENWMEKQNDAAKSDVETVSKRMNITLTAKDAAGNDINAMTQSGWSVADGTYRYVITYGEAAGSKVDAIFTSAFSGNDIYNNDALISYKNSEGDVTDYESFVIDREAPVVTIEYDDSNKLQDHYYSDTRTAAITVKDISYVYENQQAEQSKVTESDVYTVRNRMNITLTAKNAAGNDITAVTESGWNFADGAYHYVITYGEAGGNKVDAIFTSTFSGTDIYGRRISISYQDSEEKNVEDSASFVIDRKAPVITVTYTDTGKSKDHFYNADRTAVITVDDLSYAYEDQRRTAKDVLTPQERINLEITARDSLLNALTGEKAQSESNWSFANGKYTRTITFANEAIYDFAISGSDIFAHTTLDEAVGYNTTADNHSFVVDKTGPQVSLAYSDSNRTYYKGSRQAVLTMTDLSMIYNDRILSGTSLYLNDAQTDGTKSDSVKTTIRLRNDDAASDLNNAGNAYYTDSAWSLSGNVYTRTILYTGEAHYTFAIAGTDRCGNTADINYNGSSDAGEFWIDLTNPTAQISYDNNSQTREIGGRGYFRGLRTATIVITEGISTFDSSKVNISITAKDASGNPVEAHTTMSGWTTRQQRDTGSATTHTLTITYPGDANYDFGISYTDKAGNVMNTVDTGSSMSPYHFTVDTTSPSGSVTVSGLGTWNTLVSYRTFGLWSRTAVDIGAGYQDATSSVYSVEYYKTARTTAMTVSELNALGSSEWTAYSPFTIRPDDQFTIYLRIEDRSGNVTYVSSDGVILDITTPDVESIAPEITVTPVQQPVNGIYNTDVTVDIKVSDPITNGTYSGLKNVHYQVLNMGNVTQEGDLYNFSYTGGSPLQSQLVQQWTDQIIVDRNLNNSNDVQIVISAQDNSGNYASASNSVKIDVTQPQINITYDNNNGDTSFGEATYFKEDRTATIEITERNFNPDDVQITLTNADGAVPSITGWSSRSGLAANGDETVYTTTLTYSADGDYNFDITYADMAGNQNTATDYGSSLAPQVFTVDKTLPVINVSYDNNAATNGNYYSAARTATISITEHNFETGRFTITTTATDNGVSKTAPGISGWTSNGDIHTATVSFTDDAYYTIGMSYTDMAGNQAAAFTEQNFYVDKTMPYVTLQGIRNNSANNGETIGFILTCTDTNFDVFAPVLTVARLVDGQNKVETYSFDRTVSVANGIQYVIDNLPTDGIYSLVCTVYDKAGNAFNKIIYLDDNGQEVSEMNVTDASVSLLDFSVNRDGSAYKLDDATVAMLGSYYIREIGDNIVIYETNVDDLTEYVVELNGKVLEEGKDYTIEKSGGNGEWYVKKYIINKDLFEEEDEYKIVIHTKDSAENEAYSDIKGAELSFVVDKTAPEITVSGVENNGRYQVESQTVTVIPTDDGGKLETLDISVLDNNGNPVEGYPVAYKGSTLTDELDKNNGNITFAIPEGTGMSVVIHCSDVAGNEMKELKYTNIVVSTSGLTIFLANKPLFYGTVGGVVAVVGGGSAVIILRRKLSAGTKTQDDK